METIYNGHSKKSGIYRIRNKVNGRIYIGSAKEFKRRFRGHHNSLLKLKHKNKHLQEDFVLFGTDSFVFEVLELVEENRLVVEQQYLNLFFDNQKNCYNIQPKTNKIFLTHHSIEAKKKISKAVKGRKLSKETKEKISIGNKGKPKSEQHKKAMSKARTGLKMNLSEELINQKRKQMLGNTFRLGISGWNHTDETKTKMTLKHMGKPGTRNKEIYQFDKSGFLVGHYFSIVEAANCLKRNPTAIVKAAQGSRKSAYGFFWSYTKVFDKSIYKRHRCL